MTIITREFAVSAEFVPSGLVLLGNYYTEDVTLGLNTYLREDVVYHLTQMLNQMNGEGIYPTILSAYRSYYQQQIAYEKWKRKYPDRYEQISARPGTSEHQLGTTVDFGAVSLGNEFHVDFALTPEGQWLHTHAHEYGFTLSFPHDATEITGFSFEPWHYRYVGVSMANRLYWSDMSLTEHQLITMSPPCIPDEAED